MIFSDICRGGRYPPPWVWPEKRNAWGFSDKRLMARLDDAEDPWMLALTISNPLIL